MRGAGWRRSAAGCVLVLAVTVSPAASAVTVETVAPFAAAEAAGLRPGDVLSSWTCSTHAEPVASPFDLLAAELGSCECATVALAGGRDGAPLEIQLEPGRWGLSTRPHLGQRELAGYLRGGELARAGRLDDAVVTWRALTDDLLASGATVEAAWVLLDAAEGMAQERRWQDADELHCLAASTACEAGDRAAEEFILRQSAHSLHRRTALDAARQVYAAAARSAGGSRGETPLLADTLRLGGNVEWDRGHLDAAGRHFGVAVSILDRRAPVSLPLAGALARQGEIDAVLGRVEPAEARIRHSLVVRERLAPDSSDHADGLLAMSAFLLGGARVAEAQPLLERCLAIRERIAPESLDAAPALCNLGMVVAAQGDLDRAEDLYRQALGIVRRHEPHSALEKRILQNMAIARAIAGDLAESELLFRQALEISRRIAPGSLSVARVLGNLALVLENRGDFAGSERMLREALAIKEREAPESMTLALTLHNLGAAAISRGDTNAAKQYWKRALITRERIAPDSTFVSGSLHDLAVACLGEGDIDQAEAYLAKAMAIEERVAPGSPRLADTLSALATAHARRSSFDSAAELLDRSLTIQRAKAPHRIELPFTLANAADVAARRGRQDQAEALADEAIRLSEQHPAGLKARPVAYESAASVATRSGDLGGAARLYSSAINAIEELRQRAGGALESRWSFSSGFAGVYRSSVEILVDLGRTEEAFVVLERARAQTLRELLASRDLVLDADAPAGLERDRRLADTRYRRLQDRLAALDPDTDMEQVEEFVGELHMLRDRRAALAEEMRRRSPRLSELHDPEPIAADQLAAVIDPGTVVLSYCVGGERSHLFVLPAGGALVELTLPVSASDLSELIERFRALLSRYRPGAAERQNLIMRAAELYRVLIAPAEDAVDDAERLLIIPDGPLKVLPFSALARAAEHGEPRFLVDWKPLHQIVSATVYAQLAAIDAGRSRDHHRVLAVGAPVYPSVAAGSPDSGGSWRRRLSPLPASRDEVEAIASVWGVTATVLTGADATEERVKVLAPEADIIHLACHGILDRRLPLSSALAFTIPEGDSDAAENGLLQAWEIFEQLRLDADLVVLSACDTALGRDVDAEGLLGLTRAFQYAGARSVIASLWSVNDRSTARLMRTLHEGLRNGLSIDEALRQAQVALIDGDDPVAAHPHSWAGFQLVGAWR